MNTWKSIILLYVLLSISNLAYADEGIDGKEIIGFRIGGIFNSKKLNAAFGNGSELEFHFIEGLGTWYGLDISLSSHNFGDSKMPDKDNEYISTGEPLELQIYSFTAAFFVCRSITKRITSTAESGLGLYAVTLVRPIDLYGRRLTDYRPGGYGGIGLLYKLIESGFYININAKYHYVFSGSNNNPDHPLLFYTGEEKTGFLQICAGITIKTG